MASCLFFRLSLFSPARFSLRLLPSAGGMLPVRVGLGGRNSLVFPRAFGRQNRFFRFLLLPVSIGLVCALDLLRAHSDAIGRWPVTSLAC